MLGAFLPGATEADLIALSERALAHTLKAALNFTKLGVNLRPAVNIPVNALVKIAVADIVQTYIPQFEKWPGLIIDVTEEQIVTDLALAAELTKSLQHLDVKLAIDDFGRGYSSLVRLKELPFAELKLDRAFVTDCGTDKVNAPLCKTVIDLAHNFGSRAVAIGIEKASDALALAWAATMVRASCSGSRCRRSVSSRCCASALRRRVASFLRPALPTRVAQRGKPPDPRRPRAARLSASRLRGVDRRNCRRTRSAVVPAAW
jgi:predicted signal transduction protein with EAL and GGDEF domain